MKPIIFGGRSAAGRDSHRQLRDEVGLSNLGVGRPRVGLLHRDRLRHRERDLGRRQERLALRLRRVHPEVLQGQLRQRLGVFLSLDLSAKMGH